MQNSKTARFNTRWTAEQKEFFEYASRLGGFRTLSEFVAFSVQEKANEIIGQHNRILASQTDSEKFFDALRNPPEPNEALKSAARKYLEIFD